MNSSPLRLPVYQLLFALSSISPVVAVPGLWDVVIDNDPAPPAESGPAFSANAVRDFSYLPYELVAIFGAYLVVTIAVGTSILTIGKRRRAVQTSPMSLGMDMMKPGSGLTGEGRTGHRPDAISPPASNKLFGPSPVSPSKFWPTPSIKQGWDNITGKSSKKSSVANVSIYTADESVIGDDRTRNEIEMDRLYAAVAEHEAQKGSSSPEDQHPPELQHLRHGMHSMTHGPATMVEPYPSRTSTTSPRAGTTSPARTASGASSKRLTKKTPPPALSLHGTAHSSRSSLASARTRSLRQYPISPPMGSPGMAPDYGDVYSDAEPLTPRVYAPGPPPLPPIATNLNPYKQERAIRDARDVQKDRDILSPTNGSFTPTARTHFTPSIRSSRTSVSTTRSYGLPKSPRSPREPLSSRAATFPRIREQPSVEAGLRLPNSPRSPRSPRHARNQSYASCESDIKPGFEFALSPAPSGHTIRHDGKASPTESTHTSASLRDKKKRAAPPQLTINPDSNHGSTLTLPLNPSQHTLPLRAAQLPLRDLRSPTTQNMSIRAQVIDRPNKRGPAGGLLRAPNTAGLAGPATPYSPYMPQTPMTPMTPSRLIGREERKKREKEERKRVLTQEDVVKEEDEMWE